jgi:predicted nucleic acid-binding protein
MQRNRFDLYTSDVTVEEAGRDSPDAGALRLGALSGIPILPTTQAVVGLSKALLQGKALPAKALNDALHIAVSVVHGIDYLLTWNYRHLDNAETKPVIRSVCVTPGYDSPEICTPQELMGGYDDV